MEIWDWAQVKKLSYCHGLAKQAYDSQLCALEAVGVAAQHAIAKLSTRTSAVPLRFAGPKKYSALRLGNRLSRPFLAANFIGDPIEFGSRWLKMTNAVDGGTHRIKRKSAEVNVVLYTAITAYSICFDLWNPGARKTPGTFFEIMLGALVGRLLPGHARSKHLPIGNQEEGGSKDNVSTDIVFRPAGEGCGLVIPAKITTRERIVQPFAHQRILDSAFGIGRYKSLLLSVSEMQRDKKADAKEICVPKTLGLYQTHLARLTGIYYLDPPTRYLQPDIAQILPIGSICLGSA